MDQDDRYAENIRDRRARALEFRGCRASRILIEKNAFRREIQSLTFQKEHPRLQTGEAYHWT